MNKYVKCTMIGLLAICEPAFSAIGASSLASRGQAVSSQCQGEFGAIGASIADAARPTDTFSSPYPAFPRVAVKKSNGEIDSAVMPRSHEFWTVGWSGKAPPPTLVDRWYAEQSAVDQTCLASLPGKPVSTVLGQGENRKLRAGSRNSKGPGIFKISKLGYGDHKKQALLYYSLEEYPLGGVTMLVFVVNVGGRWQVAGKRILSVA